MEHYLNNLYCCTVVQENNIWRASACETCVCQQGVSVCSQTKCTDVKCDEVINVASFIPYLH